MNFAKPEDRTSQNRGRIKYRDVCSKPLIFLCYNIYWKTMPFHHFICPFFELPDKEKKT